MGSQAEVAAPASFPGWAPQGWSCPGLADWKTCAPLPRLASTGMSGIGELGKRRCTPPHPCLASPGQDRPRGVKQGKLCLLFHGNPVLLLSWWATPGLDRVWEPALDVIPPLPWQNYSASSMAELPKACNGGEAKPALPWLASPCGDTAGGVRTWKLNLLL